PTSRPLHRHRRGAWRVRRAGLRGHPGQRPGRPGPPAVAAMNPHLPTPLRRRDTIVAVICGFTVAAMVGAAYAAVPLYNWFCRTTGFAGTTQVATAGPSGMIDRKIVVRFDANVGPGLPWRFEPEQNSIEVKLGQVVTVNYRVVNEAARPITASAA